MNTMTVAEHHRQVEHLEEWNQSLRQENAALRDILGGCLGYFENLAKQTTEQHTGVYWAPDESWLAPVRAALALPDPDAGDPTR